MADNSDGYAINLDAGQTVTVVLATRDGLQGSIELREPGGASVATAAATAPDETVVLQTAPAVNAGTYRVLIGGVAASTGGYTAQLIVNAAVEREQYGGSTNDTLATAQDLSGSLIDVGTGLQRAAVLGELHTTLLGGTVSRISGVTYGAALSTVMDGTLLPRGTSWSSGTVYWYDLNTVLEITLDSPQRITAARIQADTNDLYQLDWYDASDATWKPLWTVPNYSARLSSGVVTRPDYPVTDSNQFSAFAQPVTTDKLRFRAVSGDGSYAVSEIQLQTGDDLYSMVLQEGAAVSSMLTERGFGSVSLALLDDTGATLTYGLSGAGNVSQTIQDFVVPVTGTYYWRVSGHGAYSLLITQGASFDLEPNDSVAAAQAISTTDAVLGQQWRTRTSSEGFESGELASPDWSTYSSGSGRVRVTDQYGAGSGDFTLLMDSASGWALNEAIWTVDVSEATTAMLSFQHRSFGSEGNHSLSSSYVGQTSADGVSFSLNGTNWYRLWSPVASSTWQTFTVDVAAQAAAQGLVLNDQLRIKFQQYDQYAVSSGGRAWDNISLVTNGGDDQYLVEVVAGDSLTILTSTPGDGAGEPVNTLVPRIELFAPDGSSLGSNSGGAPDGHNAQLTHTATVTGTYRISLRALSGTGAYALRVEGATGGQALHVLSANPSEGTRLATFPTTYRVDLSERFLLTSLAASDLQITRPDSTVVPADAVKLIDADTVEFTIATAVAGDGTYQLSMDTGSLRAVRGTLLEAFDGTIVFDTTGPVVVDSSIAQDAVIEPGNLTYTVTLSEELATVGLGPEDVTLVETTFGKQFTPASFLYDGTSHTLTVGFAGLYDGRYALTLSSGPNGLRDVVGNELNGAPSHPLPSGQGHPAADDFVLNFFVDAAGDVAFPTPLAPETPLGSLVFDTSVRGTIHVADDSDGYAIDLDAGQTVTVVLATSGGLQGSIELREPGGASVATAAAAGQDETVVLQTAPAVNAGTYRVLIGGAAASTGGYTAQLIVNAAVEWERYGGSTNDTLAAAQNLSGNLIDLGGGLQRAAVLGEHLTALVQGTVTRISGTTYGVALSTLMDGVLLPRGTSWSSNTVYWYDLNTVFEITLDSPQTISAARVQADTNDIYQLDWYDASDGTWKPSWTVPNYSARLSSGVVTRPDYPVTDGSQFSVLDQPVTTDKLRFRAVSGNGSYAVSEIQLQTGVDLYSMTLQEGAAVSSMLTETGASSVSLALLDATGAPLAVGLSGMQNASQTIQDFVAPVAGTYYWRVSGHGPYGLVVTQGATFDLERNDSVGQRRRSARLAQCWASSGRPEPPARASRVVSCRRQVGRRIPPGPVAFASRISTARGAAIFPC